MDTLTIKKDTRPSGEPFVWFSGLGLTLGIAMIIFLLGLIFVKGFEVFWPRQAIVVSLTDESQARIGDSNVLAGIVVKKQEKVVKEMLPDGSLKDPIVEWQLFLGNKDVYGFSFKYLDFQDIAHINKPEQLMRIERLEYGDAFGFPVALELANGDNIPSGHQHFDHTLEDLVVLANQRWRQVKEIEKSQIGKINRRMQKLKVQQKTLLEKGYSESHAEYLEGKAELAILESDYQSLAAQARALREEQEKSRLVYKTVTGQERNLPVGNIVHYYYPNQLGVFERVGLFFHKIWGFLVNDPREANTEGGVFPAIFGTCVMTILMSLAVTPFGVIAAIYLREYAKQGPLVRAVRIAVNNLAGVPSIVFGVFGLGFFVYFVGGTIDHVFFKEYLPTPTFGTGGILWASLTLALLTVPVVVVATEEAIAAVPRGMREGSLACGASKWQTIKNIVLPASAPGILTGLILAMARGASEVAPLMLIGVVKLAPSLPIDGIFPFFHMERKFMHLGFHIYDLGFQSPDSEAAKPMVFATTLLLISLVVLLNLGAIFIRDRLRKKFATGAF